MSEHTHRPTYLNFMNTKHVCRCKHCQRPLKCRHRWRMFLCALPALPVMLLLFKEGLQHWQMAAVVWVLCALAQLAVFFCLKFEVDLVQERTLQQDHLRRGR